MPYHWTRPTAEQSARGIIAVSVRTHRVNVAKPTEAPIYIDVEQPCPYKAIHIERRIARGGDLPRWIQIVKPVIRFDSDKYFDMRTPDTVAYEELERVAS